jgi:hypothetical protein
VISPNATVTISTTAMWTELIDAASVSMFTTGMKTMMGAPAR